MKSSYIDLLLRCFLLCCCFKTLQYKDLVSVTSVSEAELFTFSHQTLLLGFHIFFYLQLPGHCLTCPPFSRERMRDVSLPFFYYVSFTCCLLLVLPCTALGKDSLGARFPAPSHRNNSHMPMHNESMW